MMLRQRINDVIYDVLGGYTSEEESIDYHSEPIEYKLESIIPSKEILEELLATATRVQSEK